MATGHSAEGGGRFDQISWRALGMAWGLGVEVTRCFDVTDLEPTENLAKLDQLTPFVGQALSGAGDGGGDPRSGSSAAAD
jgi:hypothetical protein